MNRSVRANVTQCQKSWPGLHFVTALKSGGSSAKIIVLELSQKSFKRKTRGKSRIFSLKSVKTGGSLARNALLELLSSSVVKKCCGEVL